MGRGPKSEMDELEELKISNNQLKKVGSWELSRDAIRIFAVGIGWHP